MTALLLICRIKTGDEVVEIGALQRIGFEREVLVCVEIVDPERLRPRCFAGLFAVEE